MVQGFIDNMDITKLKMRNLKKKVYFFMVSDYILVRLLSQMISIGKALTQQIIPKF